MKRLNLNLNLAGIIVLLAAGVLLPIMLATAAGIVSLVIAGNTGGIIAGMLVISFTAAALGSALVAVVMTGRRARLARNQADFLANVSHELRTPLSAIRLFTQTLQSGQLSADAVQTAQCLATIMRETEWLEVMIDRVVTWRASSRDMLKLEMVVQPVGRAVDEAVARFRRLVEMDESSFSYVSGSHLPVCHDARALNCAVLNLLTNACKYTGDEKRIRLTVRDVGNDGVMISVGDNGIGLSRRDAVRIFQPFYRVDARDGRQTSGVGLGLPVSRHLVERLGGTLTVESEPGSGSIFTIRLPAMQPD